MKKNWTLFIKIRHNFQKVKKKLLVKDGLLRSNEVEMK